MNLPCKTLVGANKNILLINATVSPMVKADNGGNND
jgi:hypothetical protein